MICCNDDHSHAPRRRADSSKTEALTIVNRFWNKFVRVRLTDSRMKDTSGCFRPGRSPQGCIAGHRLLCMSFSVRPWLLIGVPPAALDTTFSTTIVKIKSCPASSSFPSIVT